MDIDLRTLSSLEEARPYLEALTARGEETLAALGCEEPAEGFMGACLQRTFASDQGVLVVAELEGSPEPLGFCLVAPHMDPLSGRTTPMIQVLFVDPRARHRGLARALVQEAQRRLTRRGHLRLAARAAHGDDALISMGERWGFLREWEFVVRESE